MVKLADKNYSTLNFAADYIDSPSTSDAPKTGAVVKIRVVWSES